MQSYCYLCAWGQRRTMWNDSIIDPLGAIDPFARMVDRYILPVITFWFRSNGAYSPFPTRLPKFRSQAMIRLSFVSQKGGSSAKPLDSDGRIGSV